MLIINREEVRRALPMKEAVLTVKRAFQQLSEGKAQMPLRIHLEVPERHGTMLFMPGYLKEDRAMAVKIVSVYRGNPGKGLPAINAVVVVVDPETGLPLALLDGTYLTALRTGAASGAATDLLANRDASRAAIFGAGAQGRTQLEAVCAVRPIKEAWIYDIRPDAARAFAADMEEKVSARIRIAGSPAEAATKAEVICTATTSELPVFDDRDIRPGTHINAVGIFKPDVRELPPETVMRAKVFVDSRDACLEEAGDLLIPIKEGLITENHIIAEIGEISAGVKPGRRDSEEITLFKSVGVAVQDAATAGAVLKKAESMGLGTRIDIA